MATHDEIASSLSRIYLFFIKIGYISSSDVLWPESPNHSLLNTDLCKSVGISQTAIKPLEKIPWLLNMGILSEHAPSVNWSDDWAIEASRYPVFSENEENWEDDIRLDGSCIPLTFGVPGWGKTMFINANTGMHGPLLRL